MKLYNIPSETKSDEEEKKKHPMFKNGDVVQLGEADRNNVEVIPVLMNSSVVELEEPDVVSVKRDARRRRKWGGNKRKKHQKNSDVREISDDEAESSSSSSTTDGISSSDSDATPKKQKCLNENQQQLDDAGRESPTTQGNTERICSLTISENKATNSSEHDLSEHTETEEWCSIRFIPPSIGFIGSTTEADPWYDLPEQSSTRTEGSLSSSSPLLHHDPSFEFFMQWRW